ncbi:MAG: DNA gyrase inhibitor YacG, partial [Gammaproteobacteria bacterium]|nr:DNA gyrase inhibitor YacG [Gammaproteobacteria bacterium]
MPADARTAATPTVPCPHCGKAVPWDESSNWKPFCSARCRLIDLGGWLSEK